MNLYYVAISRARHEARVYTDSMKSLPAAIARRFDKTTALAIQRERELQRRGQDMQPRGAAEGKQALERQSLGDQRKQPANGRKPSEFGRFG
ncbi:hypothetical protein BG60_23865 [Caballeronia zhejiangensis]|uniref:UvrD-like helicase C-terminal domain-containing protein n=2 Tax=Burkholderiaceae TaxID=119060 RepID=A0A656QD01_9BURK|nr:hypothetical protein BG60_23865 [Caballeronia zhejiangensis]